MSTNGEWLPDGWGWRARIGLITPHNDVVPEAEFHTLAPAGVSVHVARVPLGWRSGPEPSPIGLDAVRAFSEPPHVDSAVEMLATMPLDAIAYGFTSSSYLLGPAGDDRLRVRLESVAGTIPIAIPCQAVVLALRTLGLDRLALINPPWFPPELTDAGASYLTASGIKVTFASSAVGLATGPLEVEPGKLFEWVKAHIPKTADAVFIGGGGLRAIGVIDALENALDIPVFTANQVAFWQALRLAGIEPSIRGYGRIFEHPRSGPHVPAAAAH